MMLCSNTLLTITNINNIVLLNIFFFEIDTFFNVIKKSYLIKKCVTSQK